MKNSSSSKANKEEGQQQQQQQPQPISKSILNGTMMDDINNGDEAQNVEQQDMVAATTAVDASCLSSFAPRRESSSHGSRRTQAVVATFFNISLKELNEEAIMAALEEVEKSSPTATASNRRSRSSTDNINIIKCNRRKQQQEKLLEAAFDVIDVTKDGYLTSSDLFIFFQQAAKHMGLRNIEDELIDIAVDALLDDITVNNNNNNKVATDHGADAAAETVAVVERHITKEQFFDIFHRHPDLMTVFCDDMSRSTLAYYDGYKNKTQQHQQSNDTTDDNDNDDLQQEIQENAQIYHRYHTQIQNHAVEYAWLFVYIVGTITVFITKAIEYVNRPEALAVFGYCIIPARGAAACLNWNCLLILLPICRHMTTWIQCTPLTSYFPFNAFIESHVLFGTAILIWAIVHVCAHVCDFYRFAYAPQDAIYDLFGDKLGVVPLDPTARIKLLLQQPAAITGIIMVICILIAYPVILVRRTKFNTFWILHHMLLIMLIALCCHGIGNLLEPYQSVYFVIGPLVIYVASRVLRETKLSDTKAVLTQIKSGGIVQLQFKKPLGWKHVRSGMYAFLKVPHISQIEWHPFTLTSTPDDPYVEFHFASVGDWTDAVQSYLLEQIQAVKQENGGEDGDGVGPTATAISLDKIQFKVDGPMGASSQGFMDFEVVVLVGAGIGITPMISVVKYLLHHPGLMQKTYFYWTVRDYKAFEWFSQMLDDIYEKDAHGRLDIYHFLTSMKMDQRDFGTVLLAHAAESKHKKTNFDILIGNRTRHQIEAGRPDWGKELRKIKRSAQDLGLSNCGIFLCGPDAMAKDIYETTLEISTEQRRNKDDSFHFHFTKETF